MFRAEKLRFQTKKNDAGIMFDPKITNVELRPECRPELSDVFLGKTQFPSWRDTESFWGTRNVLLWDSHRPDVRAGGW